MGGAGYWVGYWKAQESVATAPHAPHNDMRAPAPTRPIIRTTLAKVAGSLFPYPLHAYAQTGKRAKLTESEGCESDLADHFAPARLVLLASHPETLV